MEIIQTRCLVHVDGSYRNCLSILGIEYQTWFYLIIISLSIGFGAFYIYSLIRKIKLKRKDFIIKSLIVSIVVLVIILLIGSIWLMSTTMY